MGYYLRLAMLRILRSDFWVDFERRWAGVRSSDKEFEGLGVHIRWVGAWRFRVTCHGGYHGAGAASVWLVSPC